MKLAVLLTYHNERQLLTECLESLASQSEVPDEVWIYDDASDFPARDYLGKNAGLAGGVRILRGEKNIGPARGRNLLLRETTAEYLHFHDSDDLFQPGWVARVRKILHLKSPDLLVTELSSVRDGKPYGNRFLGLKDLSRDSDFVRFTLRNAILPAAGTYRRDFVLASGAYREDLWQSEDYEFNIRLAAHGARYCAIAEPLVLIRVRTESRSQKLGEVWEGRLLGLEHLTPLLEKKYANELAEAFVETGSQLHRLGFEKLSHRAFSRSELLGGAKYRAQQPIYRWMAKFFGPIVAERLGAVYRGSLPEWMRRALRH